MTLNPAYAIDTIRPAAYLTADVQDFGEVGDFISVLGLLLKCVKERLHELLGIGKAASARITKYGPTADFTHHLDMVTPSGVATDRSTAGVLSRGAHIRPVRAPVLGHHASAGIDLDYLRARASEELRDRENCERLLAMLSGEMKAEMERQLKLMAMEMKASNSSVRYKLLKASTGGHEPEDAISGAGVVIPNLRSGTHVPVKDKNIPKLRFEMAKERAEAADAIIRMLEDCRFLSIADSVDYLKSTLDRTIPALSKVIAAHKKLTSKPSPHRRKLPPLSPR